MTTPNGHRPTDLGTRLPQAPQRIEMTLTVSTHEQAAELRAAWEEIVAGKQPRTETLERDRAVITSRGLAALEIIEKAIRENLTTGQAGRLVRFLLGVYNGYDYPFDLTDLRALDTRLANACLDYLNYDRLGIKEVHHHLSRGDRELHTWRMGLGIEPALYVGEEQQAALAKMADDTDLNPRELLDIAVKYLAEKHRQKSPGAG
jgi:hypothetical protein